MINLKDNQFVTSISVVDKIAKDLSTDESDSNEVIDQTNILQTDNSNTENN